MSIAVTVCLILLCFLVEGFFSGSEIALVSADRLKLQGDADAGRRGSARALKMLDRPAWSLGTCLLGTNLCTQTATFLAASLVVQVGAPSWLPDWTVALLPVAIVTPLTLTLGEMVPKTVYQHHADRVLPVLAYPLWALSLLLSVPLFLIDLLARALGGGLADDDKPVTRQELRLLLESGRTANLTPDDRNLIKRVFAFTEATVEDAMVPLIEVNAVSAQHSVAEAAEKMVATGHSRLPIYDTRIDNVCGVVLHQDLLMTEDWDAPLLAVSREAYFVPETKRADELLFEMRRNRQRLAVVVDEYGGAVGIITAEDILEELVGEIEDESDPRRPLVRRTGEQVWLASGRAEREHLQAATGLGLPDGDFETLAGFVLEQLGRVPKPGQRLRYRGFVIVVTQASDRAVLELQVARQPR